MRRPAGWPVYETAPKGVQADKRIVYVHGGAYISEMSPAHWSLIRHLTTKTPARCDVPIYPLVPHATAAQSVPAVAELVAGVIEETGAGNVVLMGDSAGAGLALAAAQCLRDRNSPQPSRLVLISPWADVSMTDPRQIEIEPRDPIIARAGLAEAGRLYAGELDIRDWRVSPLFGDLTGLAPMTVFCGTRDVLVTDSLALVERAREAGVDVVYHEAEGGQHAYPLMPTPNGRQGREELVRVARG